MPGDLYLYINSKPSHPIKSDCIIAKATAFLHCSTCITQATGKKACPSSAAHVLLKI